MKIYVLYYHCGNESYVEGVYTEESKKRKEDELRRGVIEFEKYRINSLTKELSTLEKCYTINSEKMFQAIENCKLTPNDRKLREIRSRLMKEDDELSEKIQKVKRVLEYYSDSNSERYLGYYNLKWVEKEVIE